MKKYWVIGIVLAALIVAVVAAATLTGAFSEKSNYDKFAECLSDGGLTMYGTDWCSACKSQKEMFGDSFKYVDYVNCDFNEDECDEIGITGYPTWVQNGEIVTLGAKTFSELGVLASCTVPLGD